LFWATFHSESANTSLVIIFILTILLVIITAIFSFKKHQYQVETWTVEDGSLNIPYQDKSFGGIGGGIGTAIIILLYRNIDFSEIVIVIAIIVLILGVLILTSSMCVYQHKLYLLRKYCSEVKDLKATDL